MFFLTTEDNGYESKKQSAGERDELFQAVIGLQHTLKQQCELRVENEQLKKIISDLERQNNSNLQDSAANMERLKMEVAAQITEQQRDTAEVRGELQSKLEAKELEMQEALQKKESELEQMRKRMKEQEREKQTEIIKLQLEFSARLARAQTTTENHRESAAAASGILHSAPGPLQTQAAVCPGAEADGG
ncbi:hypothetical protein COCON_G00164630 [Conger conger]|uniref:Uncharacterized protein n=1 Tax=Conger conger TaxID=82655 RepID=A0A9Q1D6S0_CONCO|nr:hypothetical protein COCON_G00164630 [Conger conger]